MAGHGYWKQTQGYTGNANIKQGALFSGLLLAISVAALEKNEGVPDVFTNRITP